MAGDQSVMNKLIAFNLRNTKSKSTIATEQFILTEKERNKVENL